ncbi:MAG: GNAT family N-acetyltransferase [Clostridia bacterium]|nr:GNAT family N-acetyltransferase [Clostridia bacterium]
MLTHKGTQTIKTERLILRRFTVDDANLAFKNWESDERVTKYLSWDPHKSPEETRNLFAEWCEAYENPTTYNWAIEYEGQPIGSISVVKINSNHEYAELGYCMGFDFWGKGIMTEAVKGVIGFLFEEVGMHRVAICHASQNPASGKVAEKCGLTLEGTQRERFKSRWGEYLDIKMWSILKNEWNK